MILRSLLFYLTFYGVSTLMVIEAVARLTFKPSTLPDIARRWSHHHRNCLKACLGIDVVVEGAPREEPAIYAMKHESFFEAIDVLMLFRLPVTFAKEELFRIPGWGRVARHYGLVPVARKRGAGALRRMISVAKQFAAQGRPLIIFPEGTRVKSGQEAPLRPGFVGLYRHLDLPIIPVAVDSGRLYQRLWKRSGTITIRFLDPIPAGLSREEVEARTAEAINTFNRMPVKPEG